MIAFHVVVNINLPVSNINNFKLKFKKNENLSTG